VFVAQHALQFLRRNAISDGVGSQGVPQHFRTHSPLDTGTSSYVPYDALDRADRQAE